MAKHFSEVLTPSGLPGRKISSPQESERSLFLPLSSELKFDYDDRLVKCPNFYYIIPASFFSCVKQKIVLLVVDGDTLVAYSRE